MNARLALFLLLVGCTPTSRPAAPTPSPGLEGAGDSTVIDIAGDSMLMRIMPPLSVTMLPDDPPRTNASAVSPRTVDVPVSTRRTARGTPGPDYWQQRADYTITAALDTASHRLSGHVTLRYSNRSPDTLSVFWLNLEQNLFRPDSRGAHAFGANARWRGPGADSGGYTLGTVTVDGRPVRTITSDTRLRVELPRPLAPRTGSLTLDVDFAFRVPERGADRMGRDGMLYYIAQWYPRVAVYDDVRGWNSEPYLGQGEFYLEYGDIDYTITLPAGFVAGGSGVLQNAATLLTTTQRDRLAHAMRDTGTVAVITEAEARAARITPASGTRQWRFLANDVRDVAWAAAPDFRWDAGHWGRVALHALYQPDRAGRTWEHAVAYTRWTLAANSALLDAPYPYPQATSVATTANGMEYPMFVVNDYGDDNPTTIFEVNDHEHGHEWFPMLVGSNERRFAWMDEGINSYLNLFTLERFDPTRDVWGDYVTAWTITLGTPGDVPLMTTPDAVPEDALGSIAYLKPAAVLLFLRNHVVDRTLFDEAMREYVRRWQFRHPTPWDFFRTVEDVTGESLGWFWEQFFFGTATIDIGIDSVTTVEPTPRQPTRVAEVYLTRHGEARVPITMRLTTQRDGIPYSRDWSMPIEGWYQAEGDGRSIVVRVPLLAGETVVLGARLWPDGDAPDLDDTNDAWGTPSAVVRRPVTSGGYSSVIPLPPPPIVNP
jgi:hypothetical protein